ncbi:MAG: bifunctional phosphopantothenoylcysteine decarboxylase/phosphopantothenate--cysteine ligase CoaBC [Hespellia sp.]|nr:bifunctional phosphopantothenoylcysteine decarboxylase/phosphopantothenate--cysteine ligase CoaBC [Hespellia sp.]
MLKNKTIILGVSSSIAAYKSAMLASLLVKQHANVHVIMTEHATSFINPITFETLTNNRCLVDTFDRNFQYNVEHVALAKQADAFLIAPATANVIAKIAHGLADDMLTTTFLACNCPKLVAPAMNTQMYENSITQDNLNILGNYNIEVITPASGWLACRDNGIGKMPEPDILLAYILKACAFKKDLVGKKILVTAGPTMESIDPVRYITNHSTGRMGYSIAKIAALRGADVTLISGPVSIDVPLFVETIPVRSAKQMFDAVTSRSDDMDIIIKAAAVADYRPAQISSQKMKKSDTDLSIALERTDDILKYLGEQKGEGQFLCGFSMETEHMLENSRAKLASKHLDLIVANNLRTEGAGFGGDTNVVTLITSDEEKELERMSKDDVAHQIFDFILSRIHA